MTGGPRGPPISKALSTWAVSYDDSTLHHRRWTTSASKRRLLKRRTTKHRRRWTTTTAAATKGSWRWTTEPAAKLLLWWWTSAKLRRWRTTHATDWIRLHCCTAKPPVVSHNLSIYLVLLLLMYTQTTKSLLWSAPSKRDPVGHRETISQSAAQIEIYSIA
jgi:hypothetical protein